MSDFSNIVAESVDLFIKELISIKSTITIYEFMLEIKNRFNPNINMILYDDLAKYVGRDQEYCIDARFYYKYARIMINNPADFILATCDPKSNIIKVLDRSKLSNIKDYQFLHVEELVRSQGGGRLSNRYMMKPKSFHRLLMDIPDKYRSARQLFSDYNYFIMDCIKYYDDFQIGVKKLIIAEQNILLNMKDDKIDTLQITVENQSGKIDLQLEKIDQLLEFGNKLIGQNDKIQLTLDMTREELGESLDYLVDKSYLSTINPDNELKVTHFTVLTPIDADYEGKTLLVRGQLGHINKTIKKNLSTHTAVINTTYNANAINLIENSKQAFKKYRKKYLKKYNDKVIAYNQKLKMEIDIQNMFRTRQRNYISERQEKLTISDIPITFNNTAIYYEDNEHIKFEKIIEIINKMNKKTQASPITNS